MVEVVRRNESSMHIFTMTFANDGQEAEVEAEVAVAGLWHTQPGRQ